MIAAWARLSVVSAAAGVAASVLADRIALALLIPTAFAMNAAMAGALLALAVLYVAANVLDSVVRVWNKQRTRVE